MDLLDRLRRRGSTPAPSDRPTAHRMRRWRRFGAIGCAALAVGTCVQAVSPSPPETTRALVAGEALAAGTVLTDEHLQTVELPAEAAGWGGSADRLVGRTLATPVEQGDPLTPRSVLGEDQLPDGKELLFLPVLDAPVLDAARPGGTVRLIDRATGDTLAPHAVVHGAAGADPESPEAVGGLWVALTPEEADEVSLAGVQQTGTETPVAVTLVRPEEKGS
ncbi:SAF domain-containing protein [Kytococcus sp. Marseille-QA3725]